MLDQIALHDAWYVGDPTGLTSIYQGGKPAALTRPSQHAGGVVGAVSRFFWGKPQADGEERTRLHIPIASDIATTSADLLFSEPPRFLLPRINDETEHPAQSRLEDIINTPQVHAGLVEAAEYAAAHGGVYLRIVWDKDLTDHPFWTVVAADAALPRWKFGRLNHVTFWTILERTGSTVLRHVETHRPGFIGHELYLGTDSDLGKPQPLTDHHATAWAADLVNDASEIPTGVTTLTVAYVPNMLPQRRWRKNMLLAPLGRSDFDGIESVFDSIDEVWSSWMRDIRLAKARVFVDQNFLDNNGPGNGASFDADREIFTALPAGAGSFANDKPLDVHQFAIRVDEHKTTMQELVRTALRGAGFSPASFGDDAGAVQETATQVKSKQQLSERTRDKKIRYWKAALTPLISTLLEIDKNVFGDNKYDGQPVEVRFTEKSQQDVLELAETIQYLSNAQAISTELKVRMMHPDWDKLKVDEEVERIKEDLAAPLGDPFLERNLPTE